MTQPIQPPNPVNATVTIQPVTSAVPNRESGAAPNPLSGIANGTTIEGFVVNRDAQNNPILRTAIGDLRVTSEVFLKTGSEVIIKVDNTLASLARILTVDGLTPQDYNAQSTRGALIKDTVTSSGFQPLLNAATAPATASGKTPTVPVLQAIILQSQPQTPSLLASALAASQSGPVQALAKLAQLRVGTPIRLNVFDLRLPPLPVALSTVPESNKIDTLVPARPSAPSPQAQQQQTLTPIQAALRQSQTPSTVTISSATLSETPANEKASTPLIPQPNQPITEDELAPLQTALNLKTTITALAQTVRETEKQPLLAETTSPYFKSSELAIPPNSAREIAVPIDVSRTVAGQQTAQPASSLATPSNQISASVIGHDADGANILHTPFATLKVYTPHPLPTGTTLLVEASVETNPAQVKALAPSIEEEQFISSMPKSDKALDDVLSWLLTNQPDAARDLQLRLPNIQQKLASGLLFFIAAMKGGVAGELIGKRTLRLLELNAPDLLARLKQDISQMQANITQSPLMHWTVYTLPMMLGQEMQHARLYVGKEPDETKETESVGPRGQRFVLEVELSKLGALQFDGFVRGAERNKSFDLMVRSASALDSEISDGIRAIFNTSMQVTGMKGQVIFQQGSQHFVKPMADQKPRSSGDGMHTILA